MTDFTEDLEDVEGDPAITDDGTHRLPAQIVTPPEAAGIRIDTWLSRLPGAPSRNRVQQLVKDCLVMVDGKPARGSYEILGGEKVEVIWPEVDDAWPFPQDIPVDIVYHDDDVIVLNKQADMVVHPSGGHPDGTLVNALAFLFPNLPGINGIRRPGIVHRLDRDTTGLMVVAKNDRAMTSLAKQLAERTVERRYLAVILGDPGWDTITVDAAIGRDPVNRMKRAIDGGFAKNAVSNFTVLKRSGQFTLIGCKLETGRTHQIRIHCRHIGHPILCDEIYDGHMHRCIERLTNKQFELKRSILHYNRPFLHARSLAFHHPSLNKKVIFEEPPPADSGRLLKMIFGPSASEFLAERRYSV